MESDAVQSANKSSELNNMANVFVDEAADDMDVSEQ